MIPVRPRAPDNQVNVEGGLSPERNASAGLPIKTIRNGNIGSSPATNASLSFVPGSSPANDSTNGQAVYRDRLVEVAIQHTVEKIVPVEVIVEKMIEKEVVREVQVTWRLDRAFCFLLFVDSVKLCAV